MSNKILIISSLQEDGHKKIIHYSTMKSYLLADGLRYLKNYVISFMTSSDNIYKVEPYTYIPHNLLTIEKLKDFKYVFFTLWNPEVLEQVMKTGVVERIFQAKQKYGIKVICRTCMYPWKLDCQPLISDKKDCFTLELFDKIFVQTEKIKLPLIVSHKVMHKRLNVEEFNKNAGGKLKNIINFDEMTFKPTSEFEYINYALPSDKINLVYMGRLSACNGMDIIFLIKLMKRLGHRYILHILPGSFILPNGEKKKQSPHRNHQFLNLKQFVENYKLDFLEKHLPDFWNEQNLRDEDDDYQNCNIIVHRQIEYGKHFSFLKQCDVALGFSRDKRIITAEGSAKLFDYLNSGIKIVFENGWHNAKYIKQYNMGRVLPSNSTITDFIEGIDDVLNKLKVEDMQHQKFVKEHNYIERTKRLLELIN
jgi:hypothetical protein